MAVLQCSKCKVEKLPEEFAPDKKMLSGRKSWCRECTRAHQRVARQSEEYKAKRRAYRKTPEVKAKEVEYMRQWAGASERVAVTEKVCTNCGETKPADRFGPNKKTSDGLASWCKACVAAKSKECRQTPEAKSRIAAYAKTPKVKAWRAAYQKSDRYKACVAKYQQSDKCKASRVRGKARRRMAEESVANTLTGWDWNRILKENGRACFYCRRPFTAELKATADHRRAVVKGGPTTKDNIVPACFHCNCSKRHGDWPVTPPGGVPADEFFRRRDELNKE